MNLSRTNPRVARLRRAAALVCAAWLTTGSAQALTVAILEPSSPPPSLREALFRLRGELLAVGLDVAIVDHPGGNADPVEARASIERIAREREVDAIIEVVGGRAPEAVDVWVLRAPGPPPEVSRVQLEQDAANPAETLAIRAIEVLRSKFVEFDLAMRRQHEERERATPAAPEPPRERRQAPPEPSPRGPGLGAGVVVSTSVDRVGPSLSPLARFEWATGESLVAQATLAGFGTRPTLETEQGSVQLSQQYAALGVVCCIGEGPLQPFLGVSAGALRTALDGAGIPPNRGHQVARWSFLAEGSFGLRVPLLGAYHLTIATHVQLAEPYPAVHIVDSLVATSGRPNLLSSLTLGSWL